MVKDTFGILFVLQGDRSNLDALLGQFEAMFGEYDLVSLGDGPGVFDMSSQED
jgi:hypothetical protein